MRSVLRLLLFLPLLAAIPGFRAGDETRLDLETLTRIRDEGFNHSQVMDTASYLCDVIGPRLTGSPAYQKAHEWTRQQLEQWGLKDAHLESWDFGRPWSLEYCSVRMTQPYASPLIALPNAWAPGTEGPVKAKVVKAKLESEKDLETFKGKLAGAIVFVGDPPELKVHETPDLNRYSPEKLEELSEFRIPSDRRRGPAEPEEFAKRRKFGQALNKFLADEKVVAVVAPAGADEGTLRLMRGAGGQRTGEALPVPSILLAAEHYNRIARILDKKIDVEMEIDVRVNFPEEEVKGQNTIAEIPGADLKDQVVLVGAHLDSWHGGTGATDDAAGVAVAMEAMRILNALEVKPRRTIRIGLWGGEEAGFLGSRDYVQKRLASRPEPTDPEQKALPEFMRKERGPLEIKPDHANFCAYFNLDNGTGKIRGIYAQGNAAVAPIFEEWIRPVADLGVKTVTMRSTGGTDHQPFDSVGLPGFQFIQDQVEYARTWHTNMDVYDRLQREDLVQASVVMAWFAYNAAMRDELLPRKPLSKETLSGKQATN
jgi:carboxypeptidase Q